MRAITVRQPWAWAIFHAQKDVENRDWGRTVARGRIAIHAGKRLDPDGIETVAAAAGHSTSSLIGLMTEAPLGAIIGTVEVVSIHEAYMMPPENGGLRMLSCHRPWGLPTRYHWMLANPRPCEPIPCRGALGLWTVPDDIAARLAGAL